MKKENTPTTHQESNLQPENSSNSKDSQTANKSEKENKYDWIWEAIIGAIISFGSLWFEYSEKRKTDKAKTENEKDNDNNKTNNQMLLDDKKTDNKIRIEVARTEAKLKIIERQQQRDEAKAKLKQKAIDLRMGVLTGDNNPDCPPKKALSLDDELANAEEDPTKLQLGWELLHKNLDCSFLGETQSGKTTFIFYLCYLLASGIINKKLFPSWYCSSRVAVLYFALEQTDEEIKQHYPLENLEASRFFRLVTSTQNIKDVLEYIKSFLEEFPDGDVLIVIDNVTVLKDDNGAFAIRMLNNALSFYRKSRTNGTLTTWRVYHADPTKVREGKPLKLSMIADNCKVGLRTTECIIINKFPHDPSMRYMIPQKQKFGNKTPQDCYLFDFSLDDDEYYFINEYKLPEILRMIENEKNGKTPIQSQKPGPKRQCGLSDEEMLELYYWRKTGYCNAIEIKDLTGLDTRQFNRAIKRIHERQQKNQQP